MGESLAAPSVELVDIWKRFPGVVANAGAHLHVRGGTVHAVLGENGAGKSTLVNVLSGVYRPDEGEVRLGGRPYRFRTPADALAAGIGMVHQEFRLVPSFTVAENVVLGAAKRVLRRGDLEERVGELGRRFGLATEPDRPVWQLSMGERQRVEILKALWRDARILILDEPTAVLTPAEAEELGEVLRHMADDGRSVIFISHKLHEVTGFCDEATVLRGGETVAASLPVAETDAATLAGLMVGATPLTNERPPSRTPGEVRLGVSGLRALGDRGLEAVGGVDLSRTACCGPTADSGAARSSPARAWPPTAGTWSSASACARARWATPSPAYRVATCSASSSDGSSAAGRRWSSPPNPPVASTFRASRPSRTCSSPNATLARRSCSSPRTSTNS